MFGTLGLRKTYFGSKGYVIYNQDGAGNTVTNLVSGYNVALNSGWEDYDQYVANRLVIDGNEAPSASAEAGMHANGTASMNITVPDMNWHTLTVLAPVVFSDARNDVYTLTPTGSSTPAATFNIVEPLIGLNRILQFRFKGNVTLTVQQLPSTWSDSANLKAVFID